MPSGSDSEKKSMCPAICHECFKNTEELLEQETKTQQILEKNQKCKNILQKIGATAFGVLVIAFIILSVKVAKGGERQVILPSVPVFRMMNLELQPPKELMVQEVLDLGPSMDIPMTVYDARTLFHITTDKMVYKPEDYIFVEVFMIDSVTKKPYLYEREKVELRDEQGSRDAKYIGDERQIGAPIESFVWEPTILA